MRTNRALLWAATVLYTVGLGITTAAAQGTEASISGSVSDKSGAFVADATVTLRRGAGEERTVKTNPQGVYRVTQLKPSVCTPLRAVAPPTGAAQIHREVEFPRPGGVTDSAQPRPGSHRNGDRDRRGAVGLPDLSSASMGVNVTDRT